MEILDMEGTWSMSASSQAKWFSGQGLAALMAEHEATAVDSLKCATAVTLHVGLFERRT